ncbi:delta(5) fatty acid desaturase A-like [Sycon ciliatum]|uniref:delta(5) fatty acid desaturase A-like n=1 Tax=Sycon ciliatum TaxID=27933 RepID=UPI0031F641A4
MGSKPNFMQLLLLCLPVAAVIGLFVPGYSLLFFWAVTAEIAACGLDFFSWLRSSRRKKQKSSALNKKEFTWEEVSEHNSADSAWVSVHGLVYDITNFVQSHPGGKEFILLAAGRDATDAFESYHPFTDKPKRVLAKYEIGKLVTFEHPSFLPDSGFYQECRDAVRSYFERTGKDHKAPFAGLWRMSFIYMAGMAAYTISYVMGHSMPMVVRLAGAIVLGIAQGLPLTHWMHDASHGSIGHTEWWWWTCGRLSLDWISGSSMVAWRNQHVIGHHIYTNVLGSDPDLPVSLEGDPRRLVPAQVWKALYKLQHLYLPPLYGVLSLKSRIQDVLEVFGKHWNGPIRVNPISMQDVLRQFGSKTFWLFYRLAVPYFVLNVPLLALIPLFIVTEFTTGYWLAFNFQVSHISQDVDYFVKKSADGKAHVIDEEWAKLQVKTSVDYSHGSVWNTFFSGALNYQTVHHLFPSVSQYHYPDIAPIILDICKKHSIKYNCLPTFSSAFKAHIDHLYDMGVQGKAVPLKLE